MKVSVILCFFFAFYANPLLAQEKDSLTIALDEAVVTGTRIERQKNKIAASISTISRETIDRSGEINVLPLLTYQVPGFLLNDRSITGFGIGPGSGGNISIRGISGTPNNRVLVLIDGQPQFMGIFAHPIADAYSASDIERVEVQRGAASVLYGSNAMGGAINLITRKGTDEGWNGSVNVGYGSFRTFMGNAHVSFNQGKFHSMVAINRNSTTGFRNDAEDSFENTTGYLKMGYAISPGLSLSGDMQLADATYFQPGPTVAPSETDKREYLRGRAALSLRNDWGNVSGALLYFHNFGEHTFQTGFSSKDQNQGITFYQNLSVLPNQILTIGMDYKRYGGKAFNETLPPPARVGLGTQFTIHETDLYLQAQQEFGEKISLNAGLRRVSNSQYGQKLLPGFGFAYRIKQNFTLKASSSKAFRSPSIVDLFLFPTSNESLRPEELWSHEAGFQTLILDNKLSLEMMAFMAKGSNLIQINPMITPSIGSNSGSFLNKGLESQFRFKTAESLQVIFNYAYVDVDENILFAPKHNLSLQTDLQLSKFSIVPSIQHISGLRNSLTETDKNENYTLINLKSMYSISHKINIYITGKNLLNTSYQLEKGFPMPGINVMTGIHLKF